MGRQGECGRHAFRRDRLPQMADGGFIACKLIEAHGDETSKEIARGKLRNGFVRQPGRVCMRAEKPDNLYEGHSFSRAANCSKGTASAVRQARIS